MEVRGYAICTEPRSGSTLLCKLLESTAALGRPDEYFDANTILRRRDLGAYPENSDAQIALIPKAAATENGIYGLKVFSNHLVTLSDRGVNWTERLPNLRFIFLERADVLGQAISRLRARQTGQWRSTDPLCAEATYDFEAIDQDLRNIVSGYARWRFFLHSRGIPYLHLLYERMAENPRLAVDVVSRFMGVGDLSLEDLNRIDLKRQRSELNEVWRQRFLSQSRSRHSGLF